MNAPRVNTISRGGSRFYVDPATKAKVPSVTSILDMLPKPFLKFWASKLVAETAVDDFSVLAGFVARGDRDAAVDWLKRAPSRNTSAAADMGSNAHELFERLVRGESLGRVHPDLQPFLTGFEEFLATWEPEFLEVEATIWNETHGYAGSFDFIAKVQGETVIGDLKTTRSGVHAEVALQMTAYAKGEFILRPNGDRDPLPALDGAAVLHVRPEGWTLYPVAINDEIFEIFLALKQVFAWDREMKNSVIGNPLVAS